MRTWSKTTGVAACILLLAVSLGPKIALATSASTASRPLTSAAIGAAVERSGFRIVALNAAGRLPGVEAAHGACTVTVNLAAPQGWNRSILKEIAGERRLVYLYEGSVYDEQPVLTTGTRYYWELLKRRAGLGGHMPGVFAVAVDPGCAALPVLDLSDLSA